MAAENDASRLPSRGEAGQGLVEYGLILVLVAIIAIVSLVFIGSGNASYLSAIGASI